MTGNAHASYFRQHTVLTEAQAAAGTSTGRSLSNNPSTQTLRTADATSPADPELAGSTFRTNVVSKLDDLVQNFKQDKILCTLHAAGLEELDRCATLEEYTLYVDIIASKHKDHREERVGRGEQGVRVRDGSTQEEEAELLLRRIRRAVLCKRQWSVLSSSGSEDDSESRRRDGESNKKKR
ncbi:hypothetical protein L208DRAFT_1407130, partial [Tricholoma matsutake]